MVVMSRRISHIHNSLTLNMETSYAPENFAYMSVRRSNINCLPFSSSDAVVSYTFPWYGGLI